MRGRRPALAASLVLGVLASSVSAFAASDLPWADANPLEGGGTHRAKPKAERRVEPSGKQAEAAKAGKAAAEPAAAPAAAPVPVPDPSPEAAKTAPAPSTVPVPEPDPRPELRPEQQGPAPAPDAAKATPEPAEVKPIEEIPVPEKRPAEAAPKPAAADPVEGTGGAEPPKPDDAPNSTEKLKAREPVIDPATSVVAAAAIEDAEECEAELKRRGAEFTVGESISEGECGVLRPVSIERLSSGVKVGPNTKLLCRAALALDIWMADAVAPAAKKEFPDRKLTEFRQASTYVCRPRASESGISEHSRGSAVDIGAFVFDKGPEIGIAAKAGDTPEERFLTSVREGACGPFKTVLGPGTDPDHATHFHLDIAARRNGATYCK